ncbi:DUF4145 domain-containing protein [Rhodopirellula bahusiensis]|uniref:DUF4145 domain-containing protein n=1 Tax=Rhodopirellula bahusiensis TaxID=2014065 RepID=A0A2G1VXK4_9BACT|nr:DUF4145 domain-containing protein [Rhodopirellula bahusiensis]PHQ31502.1 DUF4145 domain-containing protein [Rhodopirellula bahusiensis]
MNTTDRIQKRFDELATEGEAILQSMSKTISKVRSGGASSPGMFTTPVKERNVTKYKVDGSAVVEWETKALSLLSRCPGKSSTTFERFKEAIAVVGSNPIARFSSNLSIFRAAKSDFEGGYLFDLRKLIHAEVFADELDLAGHYLENDGKTAAAVVAGVVLETTLRKIVADNGLTGFSLSQMNDNLRKADIYTKIIWRQVKAWADIRNAAAHGSADQIDAEDIERMIAGIRDFVAKHMS